MSGREHDGITLDHCCQSIERHVVLVSPEIHWNTGNIGRTCLGLGAELHLIEPLGFSLESRQVKRAGLDYWTELNPHVWQSYDMFVETIKPKQDEIVLFAKAGKHCFWDMNKKNRMFLIFGSETKGLPIYILHRYPDSTFYIPISNKIRCLNLSTAAGIGLYESLRDHRPYHSWL